jgi:hypothetical protein
LSRIRYLLILKSQFQLGLPQKPLRAAGFTPISPWKML